MSIHNKTGFLLNITGALILLFIAVKLLNQGQTGFAFMVGGKACLLAIFTLAEIKYELVINNFVRLCVIVMMVSDSYFGFYLQLYITSQIFDKVQHVFGSYALSLFTYIILANLDWHNFSKLFKFIIVFSLGLAIGGFYEIAEFAGDLIAKPAIPAQLSLLDTDLDLVSDVIGSLAASFHVLVKDPAAALSFSKKKLF